MQQTNNSRKTMENEIVDHEDYQFIITRFKRINWKQYKGFAQYQYFLFVFDKRLAKVIKDDSITDVFNTEIRDNVFETFEHLKQNLDAILSEYILDDDAIFECLKVVEKLNPIYLDNNGKE
ncbi:hypothetical protein [Bhargavaea beijingensis]|uniref:Uncharacterized protein n=1 Tax=Bhargavaea beijingensis TaxID=426756 RepID=A0ABX9ZG22_9BACL|nr:hypothetical protein [Bhargavaea beijingensis]RSK36623.1 hypothetical protein EJA12_02425 [Bhargavaea beijingensis]